MAFLPPQLFLRQRHHVGEHRIPAPPRRRRQSAQARAPARCRTLPAIVHSWYPGRKAKDRRQLASVISRDGGRTWDNFRLIGFAPDGSDGFLQHCVTFVGDTAWLFYGGGSRLDTNDGKDLRVLRL